MRNTVIDIVVVGNKALVIDERSGRTMVIPINQHYQENIVRLVVDNNLRVKDWRNWNWMYPDPMEPYRHEY